MDHKNCAAMVDTAVYKALSLAGCLRYESDKIGLKNLHLITVTCLETTILKVRSVIRNAPLIIVRFERLAFALDLQELSRTAWAGKTCGKPTNESTTGMHYAL